ncbi:MAG TPA: hypothetical protein VIO33_15940 [Burkholderiaceae bacterium]
MRRRFRLWMTGSVAVVMAALMPSRAAAEAERSETHRLLRHSRYGVVETVQRIEAAALLQGMTVLARVSASGQPVIVLESSIGGTLVVMDEATERVDIPFSLQVRESADGGADVLLAVPTDAPGEWQDVPDRVVADLKLLPELVDRAVG